jgi:hypothetical protein
MDQKAIEVAMEQGSNGRSDGTSYGSGSNGRSDGSAIEGSIIIFFMSI